LYCIILVSFQLALSRSVPSLARQSGLHHQPGAPPLLEFGPSPRSSRTLESRSHYSRSLQTRPLTFHGRHHSKIPQSSGLQTLLARVNTGPLATAIIACAPRPVRRLRLGDSPFYNYTDDFDTVKLAPILLELPPVRSLIMEENPQILPPPATLEPEPISRPSSTSTQASAQLLPSIASLATSAAAAAATSSPQSRSVLFGIKKEVHTHSREIITTGLSAVSAQFGATHSYQRLLLSLRHQNTPNS